jgi:chitosanase
MRKLLLLLFSLVLIINPALASSKEAMMQMTNTLENSQTDPAWNYAENLEDGRGITFGCIGFCTGTYDGNILIKYYTTLNPNNVLAKYIPALNKIDAGRHNAAGGDGNPSVAGLNGFIKDVRNNKDPLFKTAQLYELDQLYYNPAVKMANDIGAKNALTLAFIYDMSVRHGPDGALSLIRKAGKTPKQGVNENTFLSKLISVRDSALRREDDSDRDVGFKKLLANGNVKLNTPFTFEAYGDKFTITGEIKLS